MKHLLTAIACFFAMSMSAQEALPWNPNANGDNIIGTVDLLAMLNVYGEEYSVETCFRGEGYSVTGFTPENDIAYIPSDAGLLRCTCSSNYNCYFRLPNDMNAGDVVYAVLVRDYYYSTFSFHFQQLVGEVWEFFYSYNDIGGAIVKLYFNGTNWEGEEYNMTSVPSVAE